MRIPLICVFTREELVAQIPQLSSHLSMKDVWWAVSVKKMQHASISCGRNRVKRKDVNVVIGSSSQQLNPWCENGQPTFRFNSSTYLNNLSNVDTIPFLFIGVHKAGNNFMLS